MKYLCSFGKNLCNNDAIYFLRIDSVVVDESMRVRPYCEIHVGGKKKNLVQSSDYENFLKLHLCKELLEI